MTGPAPDNERFLSRWSRLKRAQVANVDAAAGSRTDQPPASPTAQPPAAIPELAAAATAPATAGDAATTLPSIESLTIESDFAPFFQAKVPESLRRAAVKKLFADPHFNIMDGLDTYIDDYSKPDPLPPEMLARLVHARDIIDHPSNRKPDTVDETPAAASAPGTAPAAAGAAGPATDGAGGQPGEQTSADSPKDLAHASQQEHTPGVEQAVVGEQLASAFVAQPHADPSAAPSKDVSSVPDPLRRPADTRA